jgi:hypothetical protein
MPALVPLGRFSVVGHLPEKEGLAPARLTRMRACIHAPMHPSIHALTHAF